MAAFPESPPTALLRRARLYVLLTQAHCSVPLERAARQVARGGADLVQLREKEMPDRDLIRLAREVRRITANLGVGFIVNDRPDIARLCGADGVHLGQDDLPVSAARRVLAEGQIVGLSTHSMEQARQAMAHGADYLSLGPVFPTATKGYEQAAGLEYVRAAAAEISAPLVAIGGIGLERLPEVLSAAGKTRLIIAVCSAILGAEDIEAATRTFREAIDRAVKALGGGGTRPGAAQDGTPRGTGP